MIGTSRMEKRFLVPLAVAEQILKAKPARIMYLCRSGAVTPTVKATGRGSVRQFSVDDLFLLAVALRLQDASFTIKQIATVHKVFGYLAKDNRVKKLHREHGLVHVLRGMEEPDCPVLLHVTFSEERARPENMTVHLQSSAKLANITNPRYAFCRTDEAPRRHPARLVLNLTFIRRTIPIA